MSSQLTNTVNIQVSTLKKVSIDKKYIKKYYRERVIKCA